MSLADLMKRRVHHRDNAVMTVTPATPATLEGETGATVATVATVTVIERRRLWLVRHAEGWISHAFTPPITEEEVRDWYPAALEMEVEEEPEEHPAVRSQGEGVATARRGAQKAAGPVEEFPSQLFVAAVAE